MLGDVRRRPVTELGMGVEAGPHRRAPEGQLVEVGQARLDPGDVGVELGHVARELLAQGQRHGVHEMGAADLHDVGEGVGLVRQRVAQGPAPTGSRTWMICSTAAMCMAVGKVSFDDCDMLTSSLGWTGRLRPHHAAGQLDGPVGDHLVGVHVGLGPAAGLPDAQGEVLVERARRVTSPAAPHDQLGQLGVELAQLGVGHAPPLPSGCRRRGSPARGMMSSPMEKWMSDRSVWAPQ